jgi:hypothetical protein
MSFVIFDEAGFSGGFGKSDEFVFDDSIEEFFFRSWTASTYEFDEWTCEQLQRYKSGDEPSRSS